MMNTLDELHAMMLATQITDPILLAVIDLATRVVVYGTAIAIIMIMIGAIAYFTGLSRDHGKKMVKNAFGILFLCTIIYFGLLGFGAWPDLGQVFFIPS